MKTAVVLFNLGGPDSPAAVRPFLFNLFKDPFILRLNTLARLPLAWLMATRRAPLTKEIYKQIGDKSPLLELTQQQARALEEALKPHGQYKVFISMRYWHPFAKETVRQVKEYAPQKIILLPLYPQFSSTTTESSFADWDASAKSARLEADTSRICCYPMQPHFIASHINKLRESYWKASEHATPRVLFSAHGLPEKIINEGDPYQWQVEATVKAIVNVFAVPELDYAVCYQSRVGPLKWIGPSTEEELERAGKDGVPVVLVPVAFVSEHSETLVELDIEYAKFAKEHGVPAYVRVPALGHDPFFIEGLSALCREASTRKGCSSDTGKRLCPPGFSGCLCKGGAT